MRVGPLADKKAGRADLRASGADAEIVEGGNLVRGGRADLRDRQCAPPRIAERHEIAGGRFHFARKTHWFGKKWTGGRHWRVHFLDLLAPRKGWMQNR